MAMTTIKMVILYSGNALEISLTHCTCKILLSAIQQQHSLVLLVSEIAWLALF